MPSATPLRPNRLRFELERVMQTRYRIDDFQETYFVLDSLEDLLALSRTDFAPAYTRLAGAAEREPGDVLANDVVVTQGTGRYHQGLRQTPSHATPTQN